MRDVRSVLRERVTLQSVTAVVGAIGNVSATTTDVATVWAQVKPTRFSEGVVGERLSATAGYAITIRHRAGITPDMRIVWKGRTFNIDTIRNLDERKRFLTITVKDTGPDAGAT